MGVAMPLLVDDAPALDPVFGIPERPEEERPDFIDETLPAAFRVENTVGSALAQDEGVRFGATGEFDETYDPFEEIEGTKYEAHARRFIAASDREHADAIRRQIDREMADREILDAAGVEGFAASLAAGVMDPINLIPVGGTAVRSARTGVSVARAAGQTARAGLLSATAAEALLHSTQEVRTGEESLFNIGGATLLAGVLGGGARMARDVFSSTAAKVDTELQGIPDPDPRSPGFQKVDGEELARDTSAGAAGEYAEGFADGPAVRPRPVIDASREALSRARESIAGLVARTRAKKTNKQDLEDLGEVTPEGADQINALFRANGVDIDVSGYHHVIDNSAVRHSINRHGEGTNNARPVTDADFERIPEVLASPDSIEYGGKTGAGRDIIVYRKEFDDGRVIYVEEARTKRDRLAMTTMYAQEVSGAPRRSDTPGESPARRPNRFRERTGNENIVPLRPADNVDDLPDVDLPEGPGPDGGSAGAAATRSTTLAEEGLKSALGLEKAVRFQDPLLRAATSPSIETRRAMQRLAETPLTYEKNALGIETPVSVETRVKMHQAPLNEALNDLDDLFIRYRTGKERAPLGLVRQNVADLTGSARREGKLNYPAFKREVGRAMRRGDEHEIPEVAEAARSFRQKVFDPLKERAIENGLLPEGVEVDTAASYLMRVYDIGRLRRQRNQFVETVTRWLKSRMDDYDDLELEDIAQQITDRILGTPDGRLPYDRTADMPRPRKGQKRPDVSGPLKGRSFTISDELIEDFLESDIEVISRIYTRSMAPDVEMVREFGSVGMDDTIDAIRRDYGQKATRADSDDARDSLHKRREADIRDVAAVRDRILNVYALPDDPNNVVLRTARVVRSLNYLRLLGGMTISAIPDTARTVMVHGVTRTFGDGLVPYIRNLRAARLAADEVKAAGTALDMQLDSRAMALADVMDDFGRHSKFERGIRGLQDRFGVVTLMAPWNAFMKQFAGMVTMTRMLKASRATLNGEASPKEVANLAASGINGDMAARIAKQFDEYGEVVDGVWLANAEKWDDADAVEHFRAAVVRDVDRIVVTPGQDRPLWTSKEFGKLVFQFRSFAVASTQRTLLAGLQQRDLAALNGAMLSIGAGMLVYQVKESLAGRETSDEPEKWIAEGLDRSGLMGWFLDVNNITEKWTGGRVGISALTGEGVTSRYLSRNWFGALVGPSFGLAEDFRMVTAAATAGDWRQSDTRRLRRLLPYQNVFYMRNLLDEAEQGVNETLGVRR